MKPNLTVLDALLHCPYKAWLLIKKHEPGRKNYAGKDYHPIAVSSWQIHEDKLTLSSIKNFRKANELLNSTNELLARNEHPPAYYKIPYCSQCQFKNSCYEKLKEKDCISLLAGMTAKTRLKYQKKGITTITQLSYLFRPRRRISINPTASYAVELKALAIREQKTYIRQLPVFSEEKITIYIDFEGIPKENSIYLLGVLVCTSATKEYFSFWSENKEQEVANFEEFLNLIQQYPETPVYHFGSYEIKALKQTVKRQAKLLKQWLLIEKRMVNLLGYLRTHIYSPTYGNGLKELGGYLGFKWQDPEADGFLSINWRRNWEETRLGHWKDRLILYNKDDCLALHVVHNWFKDLASGIEYSNVQLVTQMKKHTPYQLQNNLEYGEDFQLISKAAYFDYQRSKIYWRNAKSKNTPIASETDLKPKTSGKGSITWKPKKVNEIIIAPPLKKCPHCGYTKLYQSRETKTAVIQTDLKFTVSGVRQHVAEYRSGTAKCARCYMKTNNRNLRIMHYGDNLFALVINYYVSYHISNELISKLIREHYGIWISPMYLVMYKSKWWLKKWEPVASYIRKIVLNSPVVHIDETSIKLARRESGYVWVFATLHTVYYHYTLTREANFLQDMLKDYRGIIISDFYPGYEPLKIKSQKCLIHLIRDLNDDLFKNQFDQEYKPIVTAFSSLLRNIIRTIDRHGLKKICLEKHIRETEQFYNTFVEHTYKSELATKCAKRFKKHWEQLWTFLHYDGVPWNNNNAEAAIKAFAQHRRGVKGQMHVRGLTEYLQMLTVAQTCRYRNISFLDFIRNKKGIWENIPSGVLPGFLPFQQARLFVRRLGLKNSTQWIEWKQHGSRPAFIPSSPDKTYKEQGWEGWQDWMGTGFLPFTKARTYMRKLHLKSSEEYSIWLRRGERPENIPYYPQKIYKHTGWVDMRDWLGIMDGY